jgi:hypothetical protein
MRLSGRLERFTESRELEARAKKWWHEHHLSYNGPTPEPWETMAEFAAEEIDKVKSRRVL